MLEDKVAVIYGAGSIGATVAQAFAGAGAQVRPQHAIATLNISGGAVID